MTTDPFLAVSSDRMLTWGAAVHATYYAIERRSQKAWRVAAQWWDALTAMHSPSEGDREIYRRLAVQAWTLAADRGRTE